MVTYCLSQCNLLSISWNIQVLLYRINQSIFKCTLTAKDILKLIAAIKDRTFNDSINFEALHLTIRRY